MAPPSDPIAVELLRAIVNDDRAGAVGALARMKDVDVADEDGRTPLMWATFYARKEVIDELLLRGADPRRCDRRGCSITDYERASDNLELVAAMRQAEVEMGLSGLRTLRISSMTREEIYGKAEKRDKKSGL
jgi:hypothetical protein